MSAKRFVLACAAGSAVLSMPLIAGAQSLVVGSLSLPGPRAALPTTEQPGTQASDRGRGLFDARNTRSAVGTIFGPAWYRINSLDSRWTGGMEIQVERVTTAPHRKLFLAGAQRTIFRAITPVAYAWTILQSEIASGGMLGPLSFEVGVGVSLIGISAAHAAWSLDILGPRVRALLAIQVGPVRVGAGLHGEYLLRLGGDDLASRGVDLSLRFDVDSRRVRERGAERTF